jgi:putative phosphoesterase
VSQAFLVELQSLGPPVRAVHGNVDEPALRAVLDERLVVAVDDVQFGMVHDPGPARNRERRLLGAFPGCGAIVYGHTHASQVESRDGVWILNPGSPTERRRAPVRTMLELAVSGQQVTPTLVGLE